MNTVQTPPYPESYLAQVGVEGFGVTAHSGTIQKILRKLRTVHLAGVTGSVPFFFNKLYITSLSCKLQCWRIFDFAVCI